MSISKEDAQAYWKENLRIILSYLASLVCSLLWLRILLSKS